MAGVDYTLSAERELNSHWLWFHKRELYRLIQDMPERTIILRTTTALRLIPTSASIVHNLKKKQKLGG